MHFLRAKAATAFSAS